MMRVTAKFGFTAADALRLVREAKKVYIFVGKNDDRYIFEVPKASITRDLKIGQKHRSRLCYLSTGDSILYFGSFRAEHHAQRCRDNAQRRAAVNVSRGGVSDGSGVSEFFNCVGDVDHVTARLATIAPLERKAAS